MNIFKQLFYSFLRGILFVGPFLITIYIFWILFDWLDKLVPIANYLPDGLRNIPGFGLVFIFLFFVLVGFLSKYFFFKILIDKITTQILKIPIIKIIFIPIRDMFETINQKDDKLKKAVIVSLGNKNDYQVGFITNQKLEVLGLKDKELICVYIPYSFGLGGKVVIIKKTQVKAEVPDKISPTEVLKFVVSGGFSHLGSQPKIKAKKGKRKKEK